MIFSLLLLLLLLMNYLVSKQQPNETTSVELMIIMSEWKENQPKKCVQQGFNGMYSKVKKQQQCLK